ncbi:hypothetical protein GCM10009606_23040 [Nocardioides aquiterrae]|uniref:Uncharacterized protein n=1 Tax=Nocardioides aquiterrae TaxID=203799 RepID=A0ABN1UE72_9ACTN
MSKRHNRGRQPQRRRPAAPRSHERAEDQPLFQTLRRALRSDEPVDLLMTVAGIVEATDPRNRDPFRRQEPGMTLHELVESFIETPYAETTAALSVLRVLVPDADLAARIGAELERRRHPMPAWLSELDRVRVEPDVWFLTHVLGDGDDYLFGVVLASGHAVSALVYVDHNLGTVVKDAFLIGEPLEDVVLKLGTTIEQPEQSLTRTDPASARATVAGAIDHGARVYPPLTSESWPMCRPVVEWLLRLLPDGGTAPERKEWTDREKAGIAADFFASRFGAPLDGEDQRDLLDSLLWFGTDYANGDPLRWSAVTVEMLLNDWFPRKIVDEAAYLAKLPELLRAFIRYAHDRVGISPALTEETLAAVDLYEAGYQRTIRSARLQGPTALLAGMFGPDPDDLSVGEIMLERLDRAVGGRLRLQRLDDAPPAGRAVRVGGGAGRRPARRAGGPRALRRFRRRSPRRGAPHGDAAVPGPRRGGRRRDLPTPGLDRPRGRRCRLGDLPRQRHRRWARRRNDRAGPARVLRRVRECLPAGRAAAPRERGRPVPPVRVDGPRCSRPARLAAPERDHREPGPLVAEPSAVGVGPAHDRHHGDDATLIVDAVDHPIGAASSTVAVVQRRAEPLADALGVLQQRTDDEVVGSEGHRLRQLLGELATRRR